MHVPRLPGHDRDDGAKMPRTEPPQVQIRDPVAVLLQTPPDTRRERRIRGHVEEDAGRVPHQRIGPRGDDAAAHDSHHGVHPHPTQDASRRQPENGQNRYGGVGGDVDECRPKIVIPVSGVLMGLVGGGVDGRLAVTLGVRVSTLAAAAQEPGAEDVHQQAQKRDRYRFKEVDVNRRQKAPDGLVADQQGDEHQHDGAGETGEITQLAGAEAEARVAGVLAGEGVGQCRDQHRDRVGRHVQAVRDQRE